MENSTELNSIVDTLDKNKYENRFKQLAENTNGVLSAIEDPNVKESVPYIINYHPGEPQPVDTIRVYRGVGHVATKEITQLPSILKTTHIDQELINLTTELSNNPSTEVYAKIRTKNDQLGNSNSFVDKAENFIKKTMEEEGFDYFDAFKSMHRWENTASPYVSASSEIENALSYSMFNSRGMVIVADIPKSLITEEFSMGFDKELSVKGSIPKEYIKSIFLVKARHSIEDKPFVESLKKMIQ